MKYNNLEFRIFTTPKPRVDGADRKRAIFRCDCGDERIYYYYSVSGGRQKRCPKCSKKRVSELRSTHKLIKHPLYRKWQDMKKRCYNPNVDRYKNYGARGISVCDEWKQDFKEFYDWSINNGYTEGLTIDRIDNDLNYTPSNCRYITMTEQGFNKKNTFYVEYNGKQYSLAKVLYLNKLSHKRSGIWQGMNKTGRPFSYYVDKLGLELYY